MSDLLPPMTEYKITDFYHQRLCFEYVGAVQLLEELKKLEEKFPKLPGLGLAVATGEAAIADCRTRMLTRNLRVAMQNGFNADEDKLGMEVRKDAIYLVPIKRPDEEVA